MYWGMGWGLGSREVRGQRVLSVGCWVSGVGSWAMGIGHWALGIGLEVLRIGFWVDMRDITSTMDEADGWRSGSVDMWTAP